MNTLFPCEPGSHRLGEPNRAKHCGCAVPWHEDGGCVRCGHWLSSTVSETWLAQKKRLRGGTWAGLSTPRVAARHLSLAA